MGTAYADGREPFTVADEWDRCALALHRTLRATRSMGGLVGRWRGDQIRSVYVDNQNEGMV